MFFHQYNCVRYLLFLIIFKFKFISIFIFKFKKFSYIEIDKSLFK
jgi:hypothetical protein